jgi:hypothetical protein
MSIRRAIERFVLWLAAVAGGVALLYLAVPDDQELLVRGLAVLLIVSGALGLFLDPIGWLRRPKARRYVDRTPDDLVALYTDRFEYQGDADAKPFLGRWMRFTGRVHDLRPVPGGRWQLWPEGHSPSIPLYFHRRWKGDLQMMKPGQRFTAEGRIEAISANAVRLTDAELVETEPEVGMPVTNAEPSVSTAPSYAPTGEPEPEPPPSPLTILMPAEPTPGRVFIDIALEALTEPFEQHTTVQAQRLVSTYLGRWMRLSGKVRDVRSQDGEGWHVSPDLPWLGLGRMPAVGLYFQPRWKDHISVLRRGDPFLLDGKLTEIHQFAIVFEECELVGVAPPPDARPKRSPNETSAREQQLDRTAAMFEARIAYVIAWHRKAGNWRALKKARMDLEAQHPQDMPDVVLADSQEWQDYIATEKRVLAEVRASHPRSFEERAQEVETAAGKVDRLIDAIRLSDLTF